MVLKDLNIRVDLKNVRQVKGLQVNSWLFLSWEGMKMLLGEQEDERRFFQIFLTGLTHGDAISFNRAILFEFDPLTLQLRGKMSIGPLDWEEGQKIMDIMEQSRAFLTIQRCIEEFDI